MSPLDQYIRRATAGLPGRTRLDKAAELRVHLNNRTQEYVGQGFDLAEAEHLAVEQMGPVEPVNRSFLGHIFTSRLGWASLVVLVLAIGAWIGSYYLFAPSAVAQERAILAEQLLPILGNFASVQVTLPKDTMTYFSAFGRGNQPASTNSNNLSVLHYDSRPNERISFPITMGLLNENLVEQCPEGSWPYVNIGYQSRWSTCLELPSGVGNWLMLEPAGIRIVHDAWLPLLLYQPQIRVDELEPGHRSSVQLVDGYVVEASPDEWYLFSIYASQASVDEFGVEGPTTPAPTATDVMARYPWLTPR